MQLYIVSIEQNNSLQNALYFYYPGRELAVDETMVGFRGRFAAKQYMPNKPTKWGIKCFTLADSANGYVLNVLVYTGRDTLADIWLVETAVVNSYILYKETVQNPKSHVTFRRSVVESLACRHIACAPPRRLVG